MKAVKSKFVETRFEVRVRRDYTFRPPATVETVGPYLAKLLASQKRLKDIDFDAENALGCGKEQIDERQKALQEEINQCKFFLAMAKKIKEPDFGKWLFTPADPNDWQKRHDVWMLDNGKLMAKIEIIPTTSRTKLRAWIENARLATDCGIDFTPTGTDLVKSYGHQGRETHAYEKKERIAEEIEATKNECQVLLANAQARYLLNELL